MSEGILSEWIFGGDFVSRGFYPKGFCRTFGFSVLAASNGTTAPVLDWH